MTNAKNKTHRWLFWLGISAVFFVFIALIHTILTPFVLGMLIAYFLHPAADKLESFKFSRGAATLLLMFVFFFTLIFLAVLIVPVLTNQLIGLINALPAYYNSFNAHYGADLSKWLGVLPDNYLDNLKESVSDYSGVMLKYSGEFIGGVFRSGVAIVNILLLVLITPVVTFYLLRDWSKIVKHIDGLLPRAHIDVIRQQFRIINSTLAGFVRGQLNVCLLIGLYYAIGLSIVGLKFGIVIGFVTGLLVIFPYVGLTLGTTVGLAVALFQFEHYAQVGEVAAVFISGQFLEAYFLTPKLVGEKVGLHPVWIIFGMLAGGALFGLVGVLLAVPLTAVIGVLIRFAIDQYLHSPYYQSK